MSTKTKTTKGKAKPKSKKVYKAGPFTWQERQHYETEFEKWLSANVSKEAGKMYTYVWLVSVYERYGIGPNGHKEARRARNFLNRMLPKFKAEADVAP